MNKDINNNTKIDNIQRKVINYYVMLLDNYYWAYFN